MSDGDLKPVPPGYVAGYPRTLTAQELREHLRPALWKRFGPETLVAGALAASLTAPGSEARAAGPSVTTAVAKDALERTPERYRKRVQRVLHEILGDRSRGWNDSASVELVGLLQSNPPVTAPSIPISFGNSYVGIFDVDEARRATYKLFAAYGIDLDRNVEIEGKHYAFRADGYDEQRRIGFKLIAPVGRIGFGSDEYEAEVPDRALDPGELRKLDRTISAGEMDLFVVEAANYPNMDGDLYTPLEYYMAAVVDYLNWIHGDRQIDRDRVVGRLGDDPAPPAEDARYERPELPGAGSDAERWEVTEGTARVVSGDDGPGLRLELGAGGSARYRPPHAVEVSPRWGAFSTRIRVDLAGDAVVEGVAVVFDLLGTDGRRWSIKRVVPAGREVDVTEAYGADAPLDRLRSLDLRLEPAVGASILLRSSRLTRPSPGG